MYAHELPPKSECDLQIPADILRSACLLAAAILAVPHEGTGAAVLQHKKALLSRLYSFVTDANGKYSSPHRSKGVLDAIDNGEEVVVEHEHVYSRISITRELLADPSKVEHLFSNRLIGCLVTQEEHRALGAAERQHAAEGWKRYQIAGVVVPGVKESFPEGS